MKKLYMIIGLISLLASACLKDNSTYGDLKFPAVPTDGLDSSYLVNTLVDTLRISPILQNEAGYEYLWTVYSNNFSAVSGNAAQEDTLAAMKELNYPVALNPGQYTLLFHVKDRHSGVTDIITRPLTVSSLNMNGWYLLKDDNGKTDFDYIYPEGRIDNWIAAYNDGEGLAGSAKKSVFSTNFKLSPTSTDQFNAFAVMSDQDVAFYRIDNGKKVMGFDSMFFTPPAVKKPQNILQTYTYQYLVLINDGQLYTLNKGALFATPPPNPFHISPIAAAGGGQVLFDETTESVVYNDSGASTVSTFGDYGASLKNTDADLAWINAYPGLRNSGVLLLRKHSGEGILIKIGVSPASFTGSTYPGIPPLIAAIDTLAPNHGLMTADVISGNYDADYIYYAKGNKIYQTNIASVPENLQVTLPEGEQVTCIQHVKSPDPQPSIPSTTDYLAIASYAHGRYKVWLYTISSTGTIRALSKPNFEGDGKVVCINYVQGTSGSRVY